MDVRKFRELVERSVVEDDEVLFDVTTGHSIGVVVVNDEAVRIGISRAQGVPEAEAPGKEAEGFRVVWGVSTANLNPVDNSFVHQVTRGDEAIGADVAKLQAGESPWFPDDTLVIASHTGEFYPGLYIPSTGERFQIEFRPNAQNDI